jgi:hypothetical protein
MDQIAPSIHLLVGSFKGATFRTIGGTVMLNEINKLMLDDPRKSHFSEQFSGTTYAITYSYHPSTKELNTSDRMRALNLGFNLNPFVSDLVTAGRLATGSRDVVPLLATPGTDHHIVPPDSTAQAEETIDPLLPTTLRCPEKNFRFSGDQELPSGETTALCRRHDAVTEVVGTHETNHWQPSKGTHARLPFSDARTHQVR